MTQQQRDQLRQLAERATPGPWEHVGGPLRRKVFTSPINEVVAPDIEQVVVAWPGFDGVEDAAANAAYIAAAHPQAVLGLLAAHDALAARVRELDEQVNALLNKNGDRIVASLLRTCLRCRRPFERESDIYRCVDCDAELHKDCAIQHFGQRVWPHAAEARGGKDYCALMERHDALFVENERLRRAADNWPLELGRAGMHATQAEDRATQANDLLRVWGERILQCIDASWPGMNRAMTDPTLTLQEYVSDIRAAKEQAEQQNEELIWKEAQARDEAMDQRVKRAQAEQALADCQRELTDLREGLYSALGGVSPDDAELIDVARLGREARAALTTLRAEHARVVEALEALQLVRDIGGSVVGVRLKGRFRTADEQQAAWLSWEAKVAALTPGAPR